MDKEAGWEVCKLCLRTNRVYRRVGKVYRRGWGKDIFWIKDSKMFSLLKRKLEKKRVARKHH